jgi:hypothetical protein
MYAMLLTAKTTDRLVTIYWSEHSTPCAGVVPTYSSPVTILLM